MIYNFCFNPKLIKYLLILFFISAAYNAFSDSKTNDLFDDLKLELNKKKVYDHQKEVRIKNLKHTLTNIPLYNFKDQFNLCNKLYDEYKSYQYDSAYVYSAKLQELSLAMHDKSKEDFSKIQIGFILLSSGMFKETFDSMRGINVRNLNDSVKMEYFSIFTRAYYDLASYDNDRHYAANYKEQANKYIDSAIALSRPGSYDNVYLMGFKKFRNGNYDAAIVDFNNLLNQHKLTAHQYAIVTSTLANVYLNTPQKNKCIELLIKATISDIQSSTKETVALFWLAELLYKEGDIKNAYTALQNALADADFYGARQRKVQIGTLLPIVASEKLAFIEREENRFIIFFSLIALLAILVIVTLGILFKQLRKLKTKEKIIDDKNVQLEKINEKLLEGTKIKEDYIGYFFNVISGYILQLERIKRSVDTKLAIKKYDDIQIMADKINIKKERDTLFYTFDHVFIKIFPNFIEEFNSLFNKDDQIWPKEHEVLTTDLRIFALMRMGISDTETVANILEYSEKTIYVYKMRIKARALVHGDSFDQRIMAIKAVDIDGKP
ncbi:MAG: hypothetical protein JWP71_2690 [Mucilaginibacter sp.]|nr:hypothetical protein [Mucilaginibacter sp.]